MDSFHWSLLAAKRSYDKIFTSLSFWTQIRFSAKFNTQNLFVFIFKFYITNSPWMVKRFLSNSFELFLQTVKESHDAPNIFKTSLLDGKVVHIKCIIFKFSHSLFDNSTVFKHVLGIFIQIVVRFQKYTNTHFALMNKKF